MQSPSWCSKRTHKFISCIVINRDINYKKEICENHINKCGSRSKVIQTPDGLEFICVKCKLSYQNLYITEFQYNHIINEFWLKQQE